MSLHTQAQVRDGTNLVTLADARTFILEQPEGIQERNSGAVLTQWLFVRHREHHAGTQ
jgi:hypothetical protein